MSDTGRPIARTDAAICAGLWTREREKAWRKNLDYLPWLIVPEIKHWPDDKPDRKPAEIAA